MKTSDIEDRANNVTTSLNIWMWKKHFEAPLKSGLNFHTAIGPQLENWPRATSRKKIGSPAKTNMMMYGIRKAPETKTNMNYFLPIFKSHADNIIFNN